MRVAQDLSRAVTVEDLIRRYNLDDLKTDRAAIKTLSRTIDNQYTIVKQFIQNTAIYTNQANSTVWFYDGVPTLLNEPYKSFTDASEHVNDLYYDRGTGNVYQLQYDTVYSWVLLQDDALAQSLAIANSEADAQDNRRRIFYSQPTPPYDTGDIWINEDVIMRCRCSRAGDSFKDTEWVTQNNYSETCVLLDVRAVLNSLITDVTNNYVTTSRLETTKSTIEAEVTAKLDGVDDSSGNVTAASIVLAVNGSDSSVMINGNKISLSANDILNLLAGNAINLTSKNITISSTNFSVDANGNVVANSLSSNNATITGGDINLKGDNTNAKLKVTYYNDNNIYSEFLPNCIRMMKNGTAGVTIQYLLSTPILGLSDGTNTTQLLSYEISTPKIKAGNIDCGTCTLNSSTDTTVYFNKTFATAPKVILTCTRNQTGTTVYAGSVIATTTTSFTAFCMTNAGSASDTVFNWIAIL